MRHAVGIVLALGQLVGSGLIITALVMSHTDCGTGITVPSTVTDTARCILDVMSKDLLSGMTLAAATDDAAIRCLGGLTPATRDQVQTVWGAHRAAEMREMHDRDGGAE